MSSSTSQNASPWGASSTSSHGGMGSSLTDAFGQSRTHYHRGYMMSALQQNVMPQSTDEIPIVPTKAKMNHVVPRGGLPHFGSPDTVFGVQGKASDQDAPPTTSVEHLFRDSTFGATPHVPFSSVLDSSTISASRTPRIEATPSSSPIYVIVFGYPPDKYSVTVEYFKSLGSTTDPEPNTEIVNCFRIGYRDAGEAMRAVRRNGEVLTGTYMIGVKWADSAAAADLVSSTRSDLVVGSSTSTQSHPMVVDVPSPVPSVGTPIRLAPSSAAFRKPDVPSAPSAQKFAPPIPAAGPAGQNPAKGVMGQMSELLFGW